MATGRRREEGRCALSMFRRSIAVYRVIFLYFQLLISFLSPPFFFFPAPLMLTDGGGTKLVGAPAAAGGGGGGGGAAAAQQQATSRQLALIEQTKKDKSVRDNLLFYPVAKTPTHTPRRRCCGPSLAVPSCSSLAPRAAACLSRCTDDMFFFLFLC